MELRKGYKSTDIGLIPEDWDAIKFTDCADLKHGFQFREEHFSKSGIKIIKIGNLKYSGELDLENITYVPTEQVSKFSNFLLKNGDILMALTGATLGKTSIVNTDDLLLQNYRVGNFLNKPDCSKSYVYYLLQSKFVQKTIKKLVNEAAQPNLGKGDFDKFIVPLPPTKAEQTAIATALSDADAYISALEKLIEKKRNIKQGTMQQLLKPKKGWVVKKLGEIAVIKMGQSPLSIYYNKEGIGLPLIQGNADVENRKSIIRSFSSMITKKGNVDDIIMSVRAPVGEIAKATFDCCLGRGVCSIKYKNEFIYHYLIYFEKSWAKFSTGSTFDSVNSNQVKELEIPLPNSEKEQNEIATILSDMDNEITSLEKKLSKSKMLKQGMMQELLTGKIRLI